MSSPFLYTVGEMRPSHQLPLLGLLLFSLIPSQLGQICEVSKENCSYLNPLVNTMVNSNYIKGIQSANILLTLRLVGIQNQRLEQQLTQQIQEDTNRRESEITSGELALVILALGACKNLDEEFIRDAHLVSKLGEKFKAEIENMETHSGNPLTNYYQLSLALLTLCLSDGSYSITNVIPYFTPENKNYYFGGQFSVDTGAMAVLALTCVKRSIEKEKIEADKKDLNKTNVYITSLVNKILSAKHDGLFGNIFSTGESMQALFVSSNYYKNEGNCQETLHTVLYNISQGAFHLPIAAAQILPALMGKTYLDVNKDCSSVCSPVKFNISTDKPVTVTPIISPSYISVNYSVQINETFNSTRVTVRKGSVFLDVMKAAQKQNEAAFRFKTEDSPWGPYIISVQDIRANNNDRTYWELLSNGQPLSQGAGSYIVKNGEYLEVRWSKY
ncbi:transcobalamin-1 [Balaenoptera acutorostrata]|uniref:Transcobalamin-1 n=1 Tax=Balaenoptera acutorostrata TaxID=9767 RepID=A0A384BA66_BALAC|nr:transcobalamin-1 [Balaenoptera acutorostrata]